MQKIIVLFMLVMGLPLSWQTAIGVIIVLNGTSSAGKSSIAAELKRSLGGPAQILRIDDIIYEEMIKKAKQFGYIKSTATHKASLESIDKLPTDQKKEIFVDKTPAIWNKLYGQARDYAAANQHVIMDTILGKRQEELNDFLKMLQDREAMLVLVYAPLPVLQQRVSERNRTGGPGEQRSLFPTVSQFKFLFKKPTGGEPPLEVITNEKMSKVFATAREEEKDFQLFKHYSKQDVAELQRDFVEHFGSKTGTMSLAPILEYDLVINSSTCSPSACAAQIIKRYHEGGQRQAIMNNYSQLVLPATESWLSRAWSGICHWLGTWRG